MPASSGVLSCGDEETDGDVDNDADVDPVSMAPTIREGRCEDLEELGLVPTP